MWLALSESNTDRAIRSVYREVLAEGMTRVQIAEAQRLVAEWTPNPADCGIETSQSGG